METTDTPKTLFSSCSTNGLNERSPTGKKLPAEHLQEHTQTNRTKMCQRESETHDGHSEPRLREKRGDSQKDKQNWNSPRRSCPTGIPTVSASVLPWLSAVLFLLLTAVGQSVSAQHHQAKVDSPHCSYTLVVNEFDLSKCPVMQADAQPGAEALDFKQLHGRHQEGDPLARANPARYKAAASAGGGSHPKLSAPWAGVGGSPDKERDVGVLKSQVRDLEERLVQEMVVSRQLNSTVGRHDRALGQAEKQLAHYQTNFTQLYRALVFVQRQLKRQRKVNKSLNQKLSNVLLDVVEVNNVLTRVPTSSRDGVNATPKTFDVQSVSKVRSCPGVTDQSPTYLDCAAVFEAGHRQSAVYYIRPRAAACPVPVWCDMDTHPGGWLVFQKRQDGSVSFNRPWDVYRDGFGSVSGEHWLGNDNLFLLTNQAHYQLRVDLWDFHGNRVHAVYSTFRVAGERDKFKLTITGFSGSAQDSLYRHNNMPFSTPDRDNDARGESHCAAEWEAGWWFNDCWFALLNGAYHNRSNVQYRGIAWNHWKRQQLRKTEMKMRPVTVTPKP